MLQETEISVSAAVNKETTRETKSRRNSSRYLSVTAVFLFLAMYLFAFFFAKNSLVIHILKENSADPEDNSLPDQVPEARMLKSAGSYPLEPEITIEMRYQPIHNNFSRYLTFKDHTGAYKRLKVAFKKKSGLTWEAVSFPNGIGALEYLAEKNHRSYWDRMYLENRGGSTLLPIKVRDIHC